MDVGRLLLQDGDPALVEFIRQTIRRNAPVTFAWFMEQALYHPQWGYYSCGRYAVGRQGDYFTNVSVGSTFGRLLALQFRDMWETLGRPAPFTIVEQGAHNGDFAADVLSTVRRDLREFAAALRYKIVEPFPALTERQRERLRDFAPQIEWCDSLETLPPFCGVHFSNELLDALPVHLVRRSDDGGEWQERYVAVDGDDFVFCEGAISNSRLRERLDALAALPFPYESEISLAVPDWVSGVAKKLSRGYVLIVDYGYPRADYYAPHHSAGTLRCYADHQVIASPLAQPGRTDITAHVDWTNVAEFGLAAGLQVVGFTDQHHFLTGLLREFGGEIPLGDRKAARQLQTLLHPTFLGRTFQFLALGRDLPAGAALNGFRFARDARLALSLR